ncbi:MAG: HD domain-containing protein [Candidatus Delongbacteria bacterium]|nr:HD domain-containing protein [Candidatus Delongbacteria bacterium]
MSYNKYIGILQDSGFFFKFAAETTSHYQVKFFINSHSLPNDIILDYIIFNSTLPDDLMALADFLGGIRYKPRLIYLFDETLAISDIMPVINGMTIHRIHPLSINPMELWKEIVQDGINLEPQISDLSQSLSFFQEHHNHPKSVIPMKDFRDENSLIVSGILDLIKNTYYCRDIQEVVFSFLKSLNMIYPFTATACYFIENGNYYFCNNPNQIQLVHPLNLEKVENQIPCLFKGKSDFFLYTITPNSPFLKELTGATTILFYTLRRKDKIIGLLAGYYTDHLPEEFFHIKIAMHLYSNLIVPIITNQMMVDQLQQKNKDYDKTLNDLNRLYDDLQLHSVVLDQIREITRKIHSTLDIQRILKEIVNDVCHLLNTEFALIYFYNKDNEQISFSDDLLEDLLSDENPSSEYRRLEDILHYSQRQDEFRDYLRVFSTESQMIKKNRSELGDIFFNSSDDRIYNYMGVPLLGSDKIKGAFFTFNKPSNFSETDLFMLRAMAESGVTAILNANLVDHLKQMFLNTIKTLGATIEARDEYTGGHTERVSQYIYRMARHLGWNEERLQYASIGGILHDIGKIGISDSILNKTEKLTEEEYTIIKTHNQIGYRIIGSIEELKEVENYILYHHEKYDGSGYPFQLKGEEIPIEGRITSIADAFDAMTTSRTYRKAMPIPKAIEELIRCQSSHFDPKLVQIFVQLYENHQLDDIFESINP